MAFTFYYPTQASPTVTVALPNPERGNALTVRKGQALGRTRGGTRVVYDRGSDRSEASFSWGELHDSHRTALQSFFDSTVDGLSNAFQVVDHHGTLWDAHFLEPELAWINTGERTMPDTDPVWSLALALELEATS